MILYNEFEPFSKLVNSEIYNDFETFSKLVHENGNENVSTNKILGSLQILAIKNYNLIPKNNIKGKIRSKNYIVCASFDLSIESVLILVPEGWVTHQ